MLSGLAGIIVAVRLGVEWHLPLPVCWLRQLTGIPCPACGCTRSLLAWSKFDLSQAFFYNPLFFLGCLAALLWAAWCALENICGRPSRRRIESAAQRHLIWRIVAVLAVLNWLYLCLELPK